jgi:endonuclease YncB( thermonuclease family)
MGFKRLVSFFSIILLLSIFSYFYPQLTGEVTNVGEDEGEKAVLLRIVDGDTIHALVNGQEETIRMLGINNKSV